MGIVPEKPLTEQVISVNQTMEAEQSLIVRLCEEKKNLTDKRKNLKENLEEILMGDEDYENAQTDKEEVSNRLKAAKNKVLSIDEQAARLEAEIKDYAGDIKNVDEDLASHISNFIRLGGRLSIEEGRLKINMKPAYKIKVVQLQLFEE